MTQARFKSGMMEGYQGMWAAAACALVAVALFAIGCQRPQSFAAGMVALCDAPRILGSVPSDRKASALAAEIKRTVINPEVLQLVGSLHGTRDENDALVREAQRRAGLASCYLLDAKSPARD